jgi:hypothetical protein
MGLYQKLGFRPVGTYREQWEDSPVFSLRLRASDPGHVAEALKEKGYTVLGLHP